MSDFEQYHVLFRQFLADGEHANTALSAALYAAEIRLDDAQLGGLTRRLLGEVEATWDGASERPPTPEVAVEDGQQVDHFTDKVVLTVGVAEGWAEAEVDPTRLHWPLRQAVALIPFEVVDGRPVSPGPAAAVRHGRNGLGRWGENAMADALVTAWVAGSRFVLLVERDDGRGWAVPGGAIEPGETPADAGRRELAEETGLVVGDDWQVGQPRFVLDPRGSDEAWAVTVVSVADLGEVGDSGRGLPSVAGGDDARRAEWVPAQSFAMLREALAEQFDGVVFPAHVDMLREALDGTEGGAR